MDAFTVVALFVALVILYRVIRHMRMRRYFASDGFLSHKNDIASFVQEHNQVADYISWVRSRGSFQIGASATGTHAHLASFDNTSRHKYRRDRNLAQYHAPNVHNCSLQVARNASADPIEYLMKYFNIKADENHLAEVESLGTDIARLEDGLRNLQRREAGITQSFSPPTFILKHYRSEFMEHVGVEISPISVPYPEYAFEYVSAGGNSSQRTPITLNTPTIDTLVESMAQKIRFRHSAAGQRALMTAKFRESIKARDGHACRSCDVSVTVEPHLLLEVDHIMPVSKGGMSTPDNLQTLCWRCNRTKADKIVA